MARVTIFYWSVDRTDRDERWDASRGKFVGSDKFDFIASYESENVGKYAAEEAFEIFNIGDSKGIEGIRSMSCGDIAVVDGVPMLCKTVGFDPLGEPFTPTIH